MLILIAKVKGNALTLAAQNVESRSVKTKKNVWCYLLKRARAIYGNGRSASAFGNRKAAQG